MNSDSQNPTNRSLISWDHLQRAAECLKCIAHPMRLRIIELLHSGEYSVGELSRECGLNQPATSEHLRLMSAHGLLGKERRNRRMYYHILDVQLEGILECIHKRYGKEDTYENR